MTGHQNTYLELRRLLSNASTDDILKRIFYRSMPKHLRDAISGNLEDSLDGLAKAADKAWALRASTSSATVSEVKASIPEAAPVSAVVTRSAPARGRGQRQRGGRQVKQESRTITLCPFHVKWGDSARRCLPSCSRWDPGARQQQVFQVEEADPASEN